MHTECTLQQIAACRRCYLSENQLPLLHIKNSADVFWVGLSSKKVENIKQDIPLSEKTNSGNLISQIEQRFSSLHFYRTNLVKCLPLQQAKIRYPNTNEMDVCFENLLLEVKTFKPHVVFLLGRQVSHYVLKRFDLALLGLANNFRYQSFKYSNVLYVPIHHPSHILVYRRKYLEEYISQIHVVIQKVRKNNI